MQQQKAMRFWYTLQPGWNRYYTPGNKEKASHKDHLCYDTIDLKYAKWASPRDRKSIAIC